MHFRAQRNDPFKIFVAIKAIKCRNLHVSDTSYQIPVIIFMNVSSRNEQGAKITMHRNRIFMLDSNLLCISNNMKSENRIQGKYVGECAWNSIFLNCKI